MGEIFARLIANLRGREPSRGLRFAAVSMIIRNRNSPSVLLIKRAEHQGDPWSGQIAFPGGKMQPEDRTARDTAIRETREEIGVDLNEAAHFLGYGAVTTTHTGTMDVVPSVFELKKRVEIMPNGEVASYRWVQLEELLSMSAQSSYQLEIKGRSIQMPAFVIGDYVVWGLTHRILTSMLMNPM